MDGDGVTWHSATQEVDIRAWLAEEDMWGCRTFQTLMPDTDAMSMLCDQ